MIKPQDIVVLAKLLAHQIDKKLTFRQTCMTKD